MSYHCSAIRCMRINPWYSSQLVTCCDDGEYAVWDLKHFQLMFNCVVANFLTDLYYLDNYTIRLVGSGQYFYDCYICEGKVINKGELTVSSVNCALQYSTDSNDYWFFFAGKEPFLNFSEKDLYNRISLRKIEAYSEISTM